MAIAEQGLQHLHVSSFLTQASLHMLFDLHVRSHSFIMRMLSLFNSPFDFYSNSDSMHTRPLGPTGMYSTHPVYSFCVLSLLVSLPLCPSLSLSPRLSPCLPVFCLRSLALSLSLSFACWLARQNLYQPIALKPKRSNLKTYAALQPYAFLALVSAVHAKTFMGLPFQSRVHPLA